MYALSAHSLSPMNTSIDQGSLTTKVSANSKHTMQHPRNIECPCLSRISTITPLWSLLVDFNFQTWNSSSSVAINSYHLTWSFIVCLINLLYLPFSPSSDHFDQVSGAFCTTCLFFPHVFLLRHVPHHGSVAPPGPCKECFLGYESYQSGSSIQEAKGQCFETRWQSILRLESIDRDEVHTHWRETNKDWYLIILCVCVCVIILLNGLVWFLFYKGFDSISLPWNRTELSRNR